MGGGFFCFEFLAVFFWNSVMGLKYNMIYTAIIRCIEMLH